MSISVACRPTTNGGVARPEVLRRSCRSAKESASCSARHARVPSWSMRIIDPRTGKSYVEKRRRRNDVAGQPRELTFSCYRRYPFLDRDRTRQWFCQALEEARALVGFQVW